MFLFIYVAISYRKTYIHILYWRIITPVAVYGFVFVFARGHTHARTLEKEIARGKTIEI